jgi:hypothetical protein
MVVAWRYGMVGQVPGQGDALTPQPSLTLPALRQAVATVAPRTGLWLVSDWHWEPHPDDLLDGLPPEARANLTFWPARSPCGTQWFILTGRITPARALGSEQNPAMSLWSLI